MKCTAPCVPPCEKSATFRLLNWKSRSILGANCDEHLEPLLEIKNPSNREPDYDKADLPEETQ